jgi:hypothetical protein
MDRVKLVRSLFQVECNRLHSSVWIFSQKEGLTLLYQETV